jgi:hypothetical protein
MKKGGTWGLGEDQRELEHDIHPVCCQRGYQRPNSSVVSPGASRPPSRRQESVSVHAPSHLAHGADSSPVE